MLGHDDQDLYDDEDDEDYAPGPGSYYNPHASTTFKVRQVPERLQFFGSTVERFTGKQQALVVPSSTSLGPGAYNVTSTTTNKKMRNTNYVPFATSEGRFHEQKKEAIPGPGSY